MIKKNTKRGFIQESKLLAGTLVTFIKKKDKELYVYVDYW